MKKIKGWGAVRDIILKSPLTVFFQNVIDSKGQLISTGLFGIFNSPKERTKKNQLYYYGTSSRIVFVHCLGELKTSKRHFEINWPLVCAAENMLFIVAAQWVGKMPLD